MKPLVALLAVMPIINAAPGASQSKSTTTSGLSIIAPTRRAAVSTNTNPDSTTDLESLLSGPPTICTSSVGRDNPACTEWLDIITSLDLLTNLTDRWAAPNTPQWVLEMVDEVNANDGDAAIDAHIDDVVEEDSTLAFSAAEGKEHTVELMKTTKKERKCWSFTEKFCCSRAFLLLPNACCVTCTPGAPRETEGWSYSVGSRRSTEHVVRSHLSTKRN